MTDERPADIRDMPSSGPEYGGAADSGVVSSVGEHAAAAGDVVDAVLSEHRKLDGVLGEVLDLVEAGDADALRARWGGIVREIREHEAAEGRVVLPAAERIASTGGIDEVRRRQEDLLARLGDQDALNADVAPDRVRAAVAEVRDHLRAVDDVIVPLLAQLPAEERMRLGEDLRQVVG